MKPWFEREQEITEFKEPVAYKGLNISVSKTKVKPPYIATITSPATGKEVLKAGGDTEQEALDSAKQAIDKREADAPQISAGGKTSVLLNTPSNNELLKDPSMYNTVYAKISKDKNGPTLVIGNEVYGSADLEASGFVGSYDRRMKKNRDSEEALPQIMFNANNKFLSQSGIKMNGRYSLDIAGKYRDEDEHTVYPLQFQGSTVHSGDRLRMNRPALTIGATREDIQPWFQRELEEAEVIKFPEPEKKVLQMPSVASYPDFMTGVEDLKARRHKGDISQASHDKLYTDLIHRFMRKESFETPWFLRESTRGILSRTSGDKFTSVSNPNNYIEFVQAIMFPKEEDKYKTLELRDEAVKLVTQNKNVTWVSGKGDKIMAGKPPINYLNFAIAEFKDQNGQPVYFGRYYLRKFPVEGQWENKLPGYTSAMKGSLKSKSGIQPADLLQTNAPLTPDSIVKSIRTNDENIKNGIAMILQKQLPIFPNEKEREKAIRDHLGEIISPMCLWQGMISGSAEEARKILIKGQPWNSGTIRFPIGKNTGLVDSFIIVPGFPQIGISSKGGKKGAPASIGNVLAGYKQLQRLGNTDVINKYIEANKILETLGLSAIEGPLKVAEKFGIATPEQLNYIRQEHKKATKRAPARLTWLTELLSTKKVNDYKNPGYTIGRHALAAIADKVGSYINNTPDLKFSEACITYINSSPLIQLYLQTKVDKNDVHCTGFKSIWPPDFKGTIIADAKKSYWATDNPNGRMAFDFKSQ